MNAPLSERQRKKKYLTMHFYIACEVTSVNWFNMLLILILLIGHFNKKYCFFHSWYKLLLNTSYLTDSYIVFTLKTESVSKNTIFGLKMMVKSGLEKFIFKSLLREDGYFYYWICEFGHFYEVRKNSLPHGGISKMFFLDHFSPSF